MPYMMGLLEGFQERRQQEIQHQEQLDAQRRQGEGRFYEYLLQSRDPEIQAAALTGLFSSIQPGKKARGLQGYLGEIQQNQLYPSILGLMQQMVPVSDQGTGGPYPPQPGSAAMPATSPVHGGPMGGPAANPQGEMAGPPTMEGSGSALPGDPGLEAGGGPGGGGNPIPSAGAMPSASPIGPPPIPNLISRFKRRGTGIPTAEEIAEASAYRSAAAKDRAMLETLQGAGANQEQVLAALLGSHGAPQARGRATIGPMVHIPGVDGPQQTILKDGVLYMENGVDPVPDGYQVVPKTSGRAAGSAATGATNSVVPDTPENRAWLQSLPGGEVLAGMPHQSGGIRIKRGMDGTIVGALPAMQTEPLGFAGTVETLGPDGQPRRQTVTRTGQPGTDLGPTPNPRVQPRTQTARAIRRQMEGWERAEGQRRRTRGRATPITQQEREAEFQRLLPSFSNSGGFKTYGEVLAEAEAPARNPGEQPQGDLAERILQRIQQGRGVPQGAPPAPR